MDELRKEFLEDALLKTCSSLQEFITDICYYVTKETGGCEMPAYIFCDACAYNFHVWNDRRRKDRLITLLIAEGRISKGWALAYTLES